MTDIEELIRETLADEAKTQPPPTGLYVFATQRGRRRQRLRNAGVSCAAAAAVGIVAAVTVPESWNSGHGAVTPGAANATPSASMPGSPRALRSRSTPTQSAAPWSKAPPTIAASGPAWWTIWPSDRAYGKPLTQGFLDKVSIGSSKTVYASATAPDGVVLMMFTIPTQPGVVQWVQGFSADTPDFGQGDNVVRPGMRYSAFQSPTLATHEGEATTQWLVVAAEPGTSAISYSADGRTWTPMHVENGIGLLKIPAIAPGGARLRITWNDGGTVVKPVTLDS